MKTVNSGSGDKAEGLSQRGDIEAGSNVGSVPSGRVAADILECFLSPAFLSGGGEKQQFEIMKTQQSWARRPVPLTPVGGLGAGINPEGIRLIEGEEPTTN